MKKFDPSKTYTGQEIVAFAKEMINPHQTMLLGMMDKVPEAMKAGVKKLHDDMNSFLEGLGPMEQQPAAQEAGWAMRSLMCALTNFGAMLEQSMEQIKCITTTYCGASTELNGLKDGIAKGEYLTKAAALEAADAARKAAEAAVWPEIIAGRKQVVELAGLPEASEATLKLPGADFDQALAQARKNATALKAKGITDSKSAWLKENAWKGETEFAGSMKLLEELHPGTLPVKPRREPLLGGGTGEGRAPKARVLI